MEYRHLSIDEREVLLKMQAQQAGLRDIGSAQKRKTITMDNGKEFAGFAQMERRLDIRTYFAHPYASWEREPNENTNGLLRQFFPKGTDFTQVSDSEVDRVERLLNNRPRKCLGYRTPAEVFWAKPKCCASD